MSKALDLNIKSENTSAVIQGLAVAKSLVRSRFLEAFDQGGTSVLCLLIADIDKAMVELGSQQGALNITDHFSRTASFETMHSDIKEIHKSNSC